MPGCLDKLSFLLDHAIVQYTRCAGEAGGSRKQPHAVGNFFHREHVRAETGGVRTATADVKADAAWETSGQLFLVRIWDGRTAVNRVHPRFEVLGDVG